MADEHEHVHHEDAGGRGMGTGMIVGILIVILVVIFLVIYGFGGLGGGNTGGTDISVPDQIDVNVNPGTGGDEGGQ